MPTPITDEDWDGWLWWQAISIAGDATSPSLSNLGSQQFTVDSKAMRKLKLGDAIIGVTEFTEAGTVSVRTRLDSRALVKLA